MSTSYLVEPEVRRWVEQLGLRIDLITSDPYAHDAEYRIHKRVDGIGPERRDAIFQGGMDRCSDFIRGYLHGRGK